jgi:3'-phosphoadenosine 5'-phosphosulfate (PAPS) 3'-phosphatase
MINRKLHISALMETDSYSYTWSPFKIHTVSEQLSAFQGKNDLQTEADRSAQRCIIASLHKQFPKVSIFGEEVWMCNTNTCTGYSILVIIKTSNYQLYHGENKLAVHSTR